MEMLTGKNSASFCRKPEIMADAAYAILTEDPKKVTGNFFIDDDVLMKAGVTNLDQYACVPENKDKLMPDFFVDEKTISSNAPGVKELEERHLNKQKTDSAPPAGKVAGLFHKINKSLSKELVEKTQAVYQFNVSGEEAGTWYQ